MANGQSAADFIAKRRAQAGKTARRRTGGGGTGGGGTGGGTSKSKKLPPVPPEVVRAGAAGLASADVVTGKAPRTELEDPNTFEESPTELGIRATREFEGTVLDNLITQAQENADMTAREAASAESLFQESDMAG